MYATLRTALPVILLAGLTGCQGGAGPYWESPGNADEQRMRAQRFDPYPQDESGPPIAGARPRGFQKPPAEIERARWSPLDGGF